MSKAKAAPLKAKAAVPPVKAPSAAAAPKKPMAQMSEAEMREEVKRMMAASAKKPASTAAAPAPLTTSGTAGSTLKAPATAAQPQSPPLKPTAPKSPASPAVRPGAPPPLKPLERMPVEQQTVSPQLAAAAPQHAQTTLAALSKQPAAAAPPKKAAEETKEAAEEEEDYYDEDFDEEAATIDEEPEPAAEPVIALPAAPKLTSPNSRIRALNASPSVSSTYMPPTPRTAQLVSVVQDHIAQEDTPLSARGKPSTWKSPRSNIASSPAKARPQHQSAQPAAEEVRRVVLPSAKQVKAGLTRNEDTKRLKRAAYVLQRVERVEESFELFSLPPSSAYEVWMREVGRGAKRNAGCQYSDDWRDEEVQTEPTQTEDEDTQAPEDQFVSRRAVRDSDKRADREGSEDAAAADEKGREAKGANVGLNWLHAASQLIEALLEENVQLAAAHSSEQASTAAVSTRYPQLRAAAASLSSLVLGQFSITPPAAFGPRQVRAVHLSSQQPDQLLLALSPIQPPSAPADTAQYQGLAHCSLLLLYDLSAPSSPPAPSKLLYCQGAVSSVAVEPERGWCVVAGLEEGSVCVWDLREADGLHRRWQGSVEGVKQPVVLRHASFTSDGPFATSGGETRSHTAAVTSIRFVDQSSRTKSPVTAPDSTDPVQADSGAAPASASPSAARSFDIFSLSSSTGNDFSFVTLDAAGLLLSWSAIEARDASLAGSDTDLTLAIGSTLKLVRTHGKQHSSKPAPAPSATAASRGEGEAMQAGSAHALQLCRSDTDEYIIALSGGRLCKEKRYGGRSAPARYSLLPSMIASVDETEASGEGDDASADEVTCIASHPHFDGYFLAGYRSGLIALYSLQSSVAVRLFFPSTTASSAVVSLHWHPSSPASFLALAASTTLTAHNLLADDGSAQPTAVQLSAVDSVEVGRGGRGGWMAGVCGGGGGAGSGRVEVYGLKGGEARATEDEVEALRAYFGRLR